MLKNVLSWILVSAFIYLWYWVGFIWEGFADTQSPYLIYAFVTTIVLLRRKTLTGESHV